ncbi:MAG: hypothetical protein ABI193_10625 [Minicystis sp.]
MTFVRSATLAWAFGLTALGVASIAGCPPSLEHPERFQTGCPADFSVETLLRDRCSRASCHGPGEDAAAGLDLGSAGAFERMFGRRSDACDQLLISPDGAAQSLLTQKLDGTTTCGARMPLGDPALSATELLCVQQWITAGIPGAILPSADAGPGGPGEMDAAIDATGAGGAGGNGAGGSGSTGGGGAQ